MTVQLKDACVDIYNAQRSVQTNLVLTSAEVFRHLNWGSLFPPQRKKFWVDELAICLDMSNHRIVSVSDILCCVYAVQFLPRSCPNVDGSLEKGGSRWRDSLEMVGKCRD